jgi:predicted alpha/beta hydrolase
VNTEGEDRQIDAQGFALASSVFETPRSDTIVVINAATGVPRYFYRHFAAYLRDQGWTAVTYDYWVAAEFQPRRIFSIGHSFGGQGLGLIESPRGISAAVGVSAQSGYWGVQVGMEKYKVWFAVTVLIPLFSRLFGFFPWSKLMSGEDLPKGVALEWARWARSRNYLLDDRALPLERYESFEAPILAYSIDDDGWGGPKAVDEMMRAYSNVTRRHLVPADFGLDRLGHMGFFRKGSEPIWNETVAWLDDPR